MAIECVSLNPKTPRHQYIAIPHQAQEVIDPFCQAAPPPAGGRLADGKNADQAQAAAQARALFLDARTLNSASWSGPKPGRTMKPGWMQPLAVDALRRWYEYLTQCGGYRLSHG